LFVGRAGSFQQASGALRRENANSHCHCEERSDEAIHASQQAERWIASLRSQ
jgi:hypothetical protein